jgi:hypothetical protein
VKDFELNSKEAEIVNNALPIDSHLELIALRLNNDLYSVKLQSGNKRAVAKIRCNLMNDLQNPQHAAHLDAELKEKLRCAINSMS